MASIHAGANGEDCRSRAEGVAAAARACVMAVAEGTLKEKGRKPACPFDATLPSPAGGCAMNTVVAACVAVFAGPSSHLRYTYRALSVGSGCRSVGHRRATAEIRAAVAGPSAPQADDGTAAPLPAAASALADAFIKACVLFDGHAEVMARRALNAYLLSEMEAITAMVLREEQRGLREEQSASVGMHEAGQGGGAPLCSRRREGAIMAVRDQLLVVAPSSSSSPTAAQWVLAPVWVKAEHRLGFEPSLRLEGVHLWVSQPPCGDCSIVEYPRGGDGGGGAAPVHVSGTGAHVLLPMDGSALATYAERTGDGPATAPAVTAEGEDALMLAYAADETRIASHFCSVCSKRGTDETKTTGGCPWPTHGCPTHASSGREGCGYPYGQGATGHRRTKPGAGVPTLSMSCSDKVGRWGSEGLVSAPLRPLLAGGSLSSPLALPCCMPLAGVVVDVQPPPRDSGGAPLLHASAAAAQERALARGLLRYVSDINTIDTRGSSSGSSGNSNGTRAPLSCFVSPLQFTPHGAGNRFCTCSTFLANASTSILWHAPVPTLPLPPTAGGAAGAGSGVGVIALNTRLGVPLGVTGASIAKALAGGARSGALGGKRQRCDGADKAVTPPPTNSRSPTNSSSHVPPPPLGAILPRAMVHFGTRYAMASRAAGLALAAGGGAQPMGPSYLALKARHGDGQRAARAAEPCRCRGLGKGAALDFSFAPHEFLP